VENVSNLLFLLMEKRSSIVMNSPNKLDQVDNCKRVKISITPKKEKFDNLINLNDDDLNFDDLCFDAADDAFFEAFEVIELIINYL
jgi:hypothetical protein